MFNLVVMCCRDSIVTPSTLVLMMAFVSPCSLYHTYPFWLVVNLTITIIYIYIYIYIFMFPVVSNAYRDAGLVSSVAAACLM